MRKIQLIDRKLTLPVYFSLRNRFMSEDIVLVREHRQEKLFLFYMEENECCIHWYANSPLSGEDELRLTVSLEECLDKLDFPEQFVGFANYIQQPLESPDALENISVNALYDIKFQTFIDYKVTEQLFQLSPIQTPPILFSGVLPKGKSPHHFLDNILKEYEGIDSFFIQNLTDSAFIQTIFVYKPRRSIV